MDPEESRYKELETIGKGGMGTVVKCEDVILKRIVAVKFLNSEEDESTLARFQKEAKSCAQLNHPNIINVFDFGAMPNGTLYLSMEYLTGESLDSYLDGTGSLEIPRALEIVDKICLALEHAHNLDILHRDLKPSNVMLTRDVNGKELIKLIDFGIARYKKEEDQELTQTGSIVGSPLYMSPEGANGKEVTKQSEVYSLGCLLFCLLTGSPPFVGENQMETLMMHTKNKAPSLSEFAQKDFPVELEEVISRCLSKDPKERFESVQSLRSNLAKITTADSEEEIEEEEAEDKEVKNESRSSSILFALACLALVSGIALSCFFFLNKPKEKDVEKISSKNEAIEYKLRRSDTSLGLVAGPWIEPFRVGQPILDENLKEIADHMLKNKLTNLSLSKLELTGSGFHYLNKLPLKKLAIEGVKYEDRYFKDLEFPNLATVSLASSGAGIDTMNALSKCETMREISLANCKKIFDQEICKIAESKNLKKVWFIGTNLTDKSMECISNSAIREIDLTKCQITDKGLDVLAQKGDFLRLIVGDCDGITLTGVKRFCQKNKDINTLDVTCINRNGTTLNFVKDLKHLRSLNTMGLNVTDDEIKDICKVSEIEELYFQDSVLTDKGLDLIGKLRLRKLTMLHPKNITEKGIARVRKSLPGDCEVVIVSGKLGVEDLMD